MLNYFICLVVWAGFVSLTTKLPFFSILFLSFSHGSGILNSDICQHKYIYILIKNTDLSRILQSVRTDELN